MKQSKRYRKALSGLEGMIVWVHDLDRDAAEGGVSRQHLQDAVVVKLLDSGIKALGIGNVPEPPGNPWLNIFVNTLKHNEDYFYSVTVRLDEIIRPERDKSMKTIGSTWETCARGIVDQANLPGVIERTTDYVLDYFVYDYRLENNHD